MKGKPLQEGSSQRWEHPSHEGKETQMTINDSIKVTFPPEITPQWHAEHLEAGDTDARRTGMRYTGCCEEQCKVGSEDCHVKAHCEALASSFV